MGKRKIAMYGLIALVFILCMMTIYVQMENNKIRIMNNRADRELEMLKKDYEKLYKAYYEYSLKEKKILSMVDSVFWADDSSAYIIKTNQTGLFTFFKKPKIVAMGEHHLWLSDNGKFTGHIPLYTDFGRVDTLKPHQFIRIPLESWEGSLFVASVEVTPPLVVIDLNGNKVSQKETDSILKGQGPNDTIKWPSPGLVFSTINL